MGRVWLGAARVPRSGDARRGADREGAPGAHPSVLAAERLTRRPAQPGDRGPAPLHVERPRWRNWFARR